MTQEFIGCKFCDGPGGDKTYLNQCPVQIKGSLRKIDHCIAQIVAALNAANIPTVASCCGHGRTYGDIALDDGRVLIVLPRAPDTPDEWGEVLIGSLLSQNDNHENNASTHPQI